VGIPEQEAADALRDINQAQRRSAAAFHDRRTSPYLIVFGVMWVVGYTASYLSPRGWLAWLVVVPAGKIVANKWIRSRQTTEGNFRDWQFWATPAAVFFFIAGVYVMMPAQTSAQAGALFPMLIALWYTLEGIWHSTIRVGLVGVALGLLTVGGYIWLQPFFQLWLAVLGGGGLILGGIWLQGA
jgi:hypothetical protein